MGTWALLQFALALTVVIGSIALIIGQLHMIERAENRQLWRHLKETVAAIR